MAFLLVFLGGGLGSVARHSMSVLTTKLFGVQFILSTLTVNLLGSFMMGMVVEYFALKIDLPQQGKLFLTTGFLGGFTTFSAFSLEVALLHSRGAILAAALYVVASILFGVLSIFSGMSLVRVMS